MTEGKSQAPDALKGEDWAGEMGAKWLANLDRFEGMIAPIGAALIERAGFVPGERCLDIGSGGGLPGIPLAIVRSGLIVNSVETVNKKASFQQQARIELQLGNFSVINERVEKVTSDRLPGGAADGVISRAFSSLADFVNLSGHLVAAGGALYAMKGVHPADEITALPAGWTVTATHALRVPGLDAERNLLVISRA